MVKRNENFSKLAQNYLFVEITKRVEAFKEKNPSLSLINLSIGDTSLPLFDTVTDSLVAKSIALGTPEGYVGYGPYEGIGELRKKISETIYEGVVSPEEIFVSDGAKCDLGRLQILFGCEKKVALLDPSYPVYHDSSLICGQSPALKLAAGDPSNFFPELPEDASFDLLFFCSPNNPTGYAASRDELIRLVQWVKRKGAILIFDAAYASYIQDPLLPRSIYEIPEADEVAIEVGSFSKRIGFSGVRLGWTVVPAALRYHDGASVRDDFLRLQATLFNGASILSQIGALSSLTHEGLAKTKEMTAYYLENAKILKEALKTAGYQVFGGIHAPYLWVKFDGKSSWALFDEFLEKRGLVTTPGEGFGDEGKGCLRFSSLGKRENVIQAAKRICS